MHPALYYYLGKPAGGGFSDATGTAALTFAASSAGTSVVDASWSESLAFDSAAGGSSFAEAVGSAGLTFSQSGAGSVLADAAGSAALSFSPAGAGDATADSAAPTSLTFSAAAGGSFQLFSDAVGGSSLVFGSASLGGSFGPGVGTTGVVFGTAAAGGAVSAGDGSSDLTFAASGAGSSLYSAAGTAAVSFTATAAVWVVEIGLPEEVYRPRPPFVDRVYHRTETVWCRIFRAEAGGVALETLYITDAEEKTFGFDYTVFGAVRSGAALTGTPTVTTDPAGPVIDGEAVVEDDFFDSDGKKIRADKGAKARVSGATAGTTYKIICLAETDDGDVLEVSGRLVCVASGDDAG